MSDLRGLCEHQGPCGMIVAHCQDIHSERVELISKRVMARIYGHQSQSCNIWIKRSLPLWNFNSVIELITEKTAWSYVKRWLRLNVVFGGGLTSAYNLHVSAITRSDGTLYQFRTTWPHHSWVSQTHSNRERGRSDGDGGVDWLQIYLSNLKIFGVHMHPSGKQRLTLISGNFFQKGLPLHRCGKENAYVEHYERFFSPFIQMLLFRQVPTRKEESSSPHLPSVLPCSSTHVIIQLHLGRAESASRIGGIFQNFLRMTVKISLGRSRILIPKTPCVSPGCPTWWRPNENQAECMELVPWKAGL